MRRVCFQIFLCLAVWVMLCGMAAAQGKGHGGGGGHGHGNSSADSGHGHGHDHDAGDRDRDNDNDRDVGPSSRPPGWDKGKKVGWGNCDEPPGLAKKEGENCGHGHHHGSSHHTTHHTTSHTTHTHTTIFNGRTTTSTSGKTGTNGINTGKVATGGRTGGGNKTTPTQPNRN